MLWGVLLRVTFVLGRGLSVESAVVVEHREVKVAVVLPVRTQHLHIHSQPSERECQATIGGERNSELRHTVVEKQVDLRTIDRSQRERQPLTREKASK